MARRKEGLRVVFVEAPIEVAERLKAVAKINRRSVNGEAVVAFERHVEAEEARTGLRPMIPLAEEGKKPRPRKKG